jgi:type IV pilus assembly protein PilC
MEEKQNFANTGTESFNLDGVSGDKIVLNIEDAKEKTIILNKGPQEVDSGNFIVRLYNKINLYLVSKSKVSTKDKATFFHLLSVMNNAGIPTVKSLRALVVQMDSSPTLKIVIEEIAVKVEGGKSISEAMLEYSNVFSEAEVGMVQSGESSGQLSLVLKNLATDLEKASMIKSKIKSAMMYPMFLIGTLIFVVSGMMIWVVPKIMELFLHSDQELPILTKVVIAVSDFLINYGHIILSVFVGFLIFLHFFKRTDTGKYVLDNFKLHIPIFGKLLQKGYLARFSRSLGNMVDSQISIIRALEITANSIGNEVYRRKLLLSVEDIKQGIPLAENLSSSELFPPMLVSMIDVGEKTAQLDEITMKIAKFYEDEVDTTVAGISKIIEPIIIVMIGISVFVVVAAIMVPLIKISDFAGTF